MATAVLYVRRFSDKKSRNLAKSITKAIQNQFVETLKRASWMDDESRETSIETIRAINFIFGYPDELTNDTFINEYYNDLDLQKTDLFLDSVFRAQRFLKDQEIIKLSVPLNLEDWTNFVWIATGAGVDFSKYVYKHRFRMLTDFFSSPFWFLLSFTELPIYFV